jgi:Ni/Co efflux regulator RcnB
MHKPLRISLALVAALCLAQGAAWAQPGRNDQRYDNRNDPRSDPRNDPRFDPRNDRGNERGNNKQRFENGHDNRPDRGGQDAERGAGPSRDFYRGQRLPSYYRGKQYVVDDWRGHGLRSPPGGYHWVQTGGDYVLVAIGTGIILELLLNR